jgi:hypothetical protein
MPWWGQIAFGSIFGWATVASTLVTAYFVQGFAALPLILFAWITFRVHYRWDWRGFWIGILFAVVSVFLASFIVATL